MSLRNLGKTSLVAQTRRQHALGLSPIEALPFSGAGAGVSAYDGEEGGGGEGDGGGEGAKGIHLPGLDGGRDIVLSPHVEITNADDPPLSWAVGLGLTFTFGGRKENKKKHKPSAGD